MHRYTTRFYSQNQQIQHLDDEGRRKVKNSDLKERYKRELRSDIPGLTAAKASE